MLPNHIKSLLGECIKSKRCMLDSALVALVAAVFFCLILPTQSYLACADLFPYDYSSLFWALIWRCVLVGLTLFVLLTFSYFRCRGLIHVLLLSLVVAGILESGPLAIGLPELNGDVSGYQSLSRKIVDSSVLVMALILPMVFLKCIRQYIGWISVALLFYSSLSLFDVQHAGKNDVQTNFIVEKLYPREDVVKSVRFSPKRNVILLILDATSIDVIRDILNDDAVLRRKFTGFVNYVNNLGMEWTTSVAIPGMMTGKYYESAKDLFQYGQSVFTKDSVIYDYLQQGFPVYMNLGPYVQGYTNKPIGDGNKRMSCESSLNQRMSGDFCFNAKQFSLFRIMPYCFKCQYMKSFAVAFAPKHDGDSLNIHNDKELFSFLSARPVDLQEHCALNLHHAIGGHPPIVYDADGHRVDIENPTYTDYYAQCKYSLSNVAKMFDVWRTNGVYDASTIILLADHSTEFIKSGANYHGIPRPAFPFLMVKAANSKGDYSEASNPTSHARIAPLLRALSKGNLSQQEVSNLLISKSRFCRQLGQGVLRDWTVAEDGKVVSTTRDDIKSKRVVDELVPMKIGMLYSFDIQNGKDYPDFVSDGFLPGKTGGLMASLSKEVMFSIRVNDAKRLYDCHVFLEYGLKSSIEGRLICSSGFDIQVLQGSINRKRYDILFKNIKPNQNGIINFYFKPAGAVPQFFVAKSIKCEYSQNFDDDSSCRSRKFKVTCLGGGTESLAIPVKPWSLSMDMDVIGRAKVIFDGFLCSDSQQLTKELEHFVDCNGQFDNGHLLSFRLFCGNSPTYYKKIMTVPDGATKLSLKIMTDKDRKTMTTMHLGLKKTKDDGIPVNDHPVELSSQEPFVKTLSLSSKASARRLRLYGITSENANVSNDKAAILMVRYFDEIGNECFSNELPLSQQFKCGYIYLPVRPNEDLEFVKVLNPPVAAVKIELSVKKWYGASHVVLKELRYCFVEDEKLSADKIGK